jgi:hypothetical protein
VVLIGEVRDYFVQIWRLEGKEDSRLVVRLEGDITE